MKLVRPGDRELGWVVVVMGLVKGASGINRGHRTRCCFVVNQL